MADRALSYAELFGRAGERAVARDRVERDQWRKRWKATDHWDPETINKDCMIQFHGVLRMLHSLPSRFPASLWQWQNMQKLRSLAIRRSRMKSLLHDWRGLRFSRLAVDLLDQSSALHVARGLG